MKFFLLILLLITICFGACKKKTDEIEPPLNKMQRRMVVTQ